MAYEVEIKEVVARHAAVVSFTADVSEMGEHMGRAFAAAKQHAEASGVGVSGPPFAYFEQLGNGRFDVKAGFPVQSVIAGNGEVEPFELPAGSVAATLHVGSYAKLSEAYAAIEKYAATANVDFDSKGPSWEEYLTGAETPPEQTQTIVYCPVKRK